MLHLHVSASVMNARVDTVDMVMTPVLILLMFHISSHAKLIDDESCPAMTTPLLCGPSPGFLKARAMCRLVSVPSYGRVCQQAPWFVKNQTQSAVEDGLRIPSDHCCCIHFFSNA
jgi:hypothetical protein